MAFSAYFILALLSTLDQLHNALAQPSSLHCKAMEKDIMTTRKDNLFFKKTTPLVIGHRGNPMIHQENTLAGFKSLHKLNVDGFETDILLTKDKKLVLFHDTNTQVCANLR